MTDVGSSGSYRALKMGCLLAVGGALTVFVSRALRDHLWLDELLTLTLLQANSLPKLWSGIVLGIDGNPPIYLTLTWLLTHALPGSVSVVVALKLANVAVTVGAVGAVYRASLRMVSPLAAWVAAFLLVAVNDNVLFVALEMRTYATYFLFAALAVLFQQRLIDHRRQRDVVALALIFVALTLSHTFGIAYVCTVALASALSVWPSGWRQVKPIAIAVVPAFIVFACWLPFVMVQSEVGRPYLWFGTPNGSTLLQGLFSSPLAMWVSICELYALIGVGIWLAAKRRLDLSWMLRSDTWQPRRYGILLVLGLSGCLLTIWVVSVIWFPMFVPRYFTPQLIAGFALHAAVADMAIRFARARFAMGLPMLMVIVPTALLGAVLLTTEVRRETPCADSSGQPFERDFVHGDRPVVVDSPHIFMPRATYAAHGDVYRFPLDWYVVLNYRDRTRGNATDFNIFNNLKTWGGLASIQTTDDLIRAQVPFLAIEHSSRAWLYNLRKTRDVTAEQLAETASPGGGTCTLWNITSVQARS